MSEATETAIAIRQLPGVGHDDILKISLLTMLCSHEAEVDTKEILFLISGLLAEKETASAAYIQQPKRASLVELDQASDEIGTRQQPPVSVFEFVIFFGISCIQEVVPL